MTTVAELAERIREAHAAGTPLCIRGGGTKDFYGEAVAAGLAADPVAPAEPAKSAETRARAELLDTSGLDAPPEHEPTELVVTAAAGMRLAALEALLAAHGQRLAFEPPRFGAASTVGGMVAAGLSGPGRAAAGSLRDHLLGVSLLDGTGELLHFGGRVIKNVAGYDVSRVMAGALGVLGLLVEVSLKVLPVPEATATLRFDLAADAALRALHGWAGRPLPIDASACWNGNLVIRLSGSAAAVEEARGRLGGDAIPAALAAAFWNGLRDQTDPFFARAEAAVRGEGATLWRLSLPQAAPVLDPSGDELIEWHGAQRWLCSAMPAAQVREAAAAARGHATMFRARDKSAGVFTRPGAALMRIHERLKQTFDPKGIFNRGRLYPGL